jgi:hypothetical protein
MIDSRPAGQNQQQPPRQTKAEIVAQRELDGR